MRALRRLLGGADHGSDAERLCRCGHPRRAHEHLRRGTDCALCGPGECPRFRAVRK